MRYAIFLGDFNLSFFAFTYLRNLNKHINDTGKSTVVCLSLQSKTQD